MGMAGLSGSVSASDAGLHPSGCTVPAVVASRIVEGDTQTKMQHPGCSFYVMPGQNDNLCFIFTDVFSEHAVLAACSIYLAGMGRSCFDSCRSLETVGREEREPPSAGASGVHACAALCVWDKTEEYLAKAGNETLLFLHSVFLCIQDRPLVST